MSVVTRRVSVMAVSLLVAAPCLAQSLGEFRPTGDMTAPRVSHTATRLHDGKILIVGGRSTNDPSGCASATTAELYDPASHTFTPTGKMTAVRPYHSATLLADGRVLIAGGEVHFSGGYCRPDPNRKSAEVYDPSNGTFTPTGDTIGYQNGHTATLLPNGRVLIVGGGCFDCGTPQVNNPELYDPSTGTFSLTGAFAGGGPFVSAAVALSDGRVLIAGTPTSELYDPLTGTFELTGVMTAIHLSCGYIWGRTATLLTNGLVLLTGGGDDGCQRFAHAELYDVVTGTFTATGSMTRPRVFHAATLLLDGTVLITGGELTAGSAEVFDPSTGRFASTADMSATRGGHSATALNDGTVLVAGGFSFEATGQGWCCFASAELYVARIVDDEGAIWTIGGNRAILRNGVHAAGGWGSKIVWTSHTLYVLGPDNNWYQWTGSGWTFLGPTFPGASPDGTTVPHATQIVDDEGATWTIGPDRAILRNGVHAAGGWGSQIVWTSQTLYVLGPDNHWYQWTGSSWMFLGPTFPGASRDGTTVPDATQIVDDEGATWTIGPNGAILRNGVHAAGGWGSQIVWTSHTLYVLGPDNHWYQWTGSSWTFLGPTFPGASPDGTTVLTPIVDDDGAIWTIGGNRAILRNGVHAAGGWGSQIVWTSHTLYVLGPDNNWYQWTGSSWTFLGPTFPGASLDGTTVPPATYDAEHPPATQIVDDDGAIWTIGPNRAILRNGVHAAGGWGSQIIWTSHTLYVLGPDNNWYQWTGSSWTFLGPTFPGASPDGTTVPHATQIVDTTGAIWTIGGNRAILRNGVHAAGGWGSQIVWTSHTLYVLGPDNNWYQWTGFSWTFLGATFPGGAVNLNGGLSLSVEN